MIRKANSPKETLSLSRRNNGKCILANQKTANRKLICNFLCINPVRVKMVLLYALSLMVSEIIIFYIKMVKLDDFSKFRTHDLEVLSPYYEKTSLLSIDNITAKFEDATSCSYRDKLRTIFLHKNGKIGSFFKILSP